MVRRRWVMRILAFACALGVVRLVVPWWCGRDGGRWFGWDAEIQHELAAEVIAFEASEAAAPVGADRFTGEWALVTHQMIALGLAQLCLAHPEWRAEMAPVATRAAANSFRREMRDFGTK